MASETLDVFSVLANRLGAWSVKAELEDLAFKTLQPEDYEAVSAAVAARTAAIDLPMRVAQVRAALAAAGLEVVDVSGRVKNIYGVWRKLQAGGLGVERIDEVYDVAALRVVVPHKHDCYRALREVEGLWAAVPGRFKVGGASFGGPGIGARPGVVHGRSTAQLWTDGCACIFFRLSGPAQFRRILCNSHCVAYPQTQDYIRNRKGNGYQSLHTSVTAAAGDAAVADDVTGLPAALLEVQVRAGLYAGSRARPSACGPPAL
jgi:ppGpp synthetase/RelA/SpoT-type nucleotidyltranferase